MSDYGGWFLEPSAQAECPDCGQLVGATSDLDLLLDLIDEHLLRECSP
jgi:hypothetical protein